MSERPSGQPSAADAAGGLPAAPAGTAIDVVAAVVARALGEDAVDPDTGFFDLGAGSLDLLTIVEELRGRWAHLRVVDCFLYPTVNSLAAYLEGAA